MWAEDAARAVASCRRFPKGGRSDVNELLCGVANELNEVGRSRFVSGLPVPGVVACISLRHRVGCAQQYQTASDQTELDLDFH